MITKIDYKTHHRIRNFPAKQIMGIEGYPQAVTDGYALDLYAIDGRPRQKNFPTGPFANIVNEVESCNVVLSEPKYTVDDYNEYFIVLNQKKESVGIQEKYYQYFTARYPGCVFIQDERLLPIGVRHEGRLVGVVMPIMIGQDTAEYYE